MALLTGAACAPLPRLGTPDSVSGEEVSAWIETRPLGEVGKLVIVRNDSPAELHVDSLELSRTVNVSGGDGARTWGAVLATGESDTLLISPHDSLQAVAFEMKIHWRKVTRTTITKPLLIPEADSNAVGGSF